MELFDTIITEEAKNYVEQVFNSGHLSEGHFVSEFEKELERVFGYSFGVAVNSGTSALHLALILAGVEPGDEVILPAQTFVATGMAVLYCGAKCVFVDIGDDGNISVDSVSRAITRKTKAVIAVSWAGNPCDLYVLSELCGYHHIKLIQDNAQSLGASYLGKPVTHYGDFSCFSFQATKHLTTGDGGLLVCSQYDDYKLAKRLRWFGIDRVRDIPDLTGERHYNLKRIGYKYHMNDVSAALGLGNLTHIQERIEHRRKIANHYDRCISSHYQVPRMSGSSNWVYNLLVDKRNDLIKMLASHGIPASVVHVGIDRNDLFGSVVDLPMQRIWDAQHVCLPCHSGVTEHDVEKIGELLYAGW